MVFKIKCKTYNNKKKQDANIQHLQKNEKNTETSKIAKAMHILQKHVNI